MPGHLETLLAFDRQYQRDQQQSPVFLHRRDRRYALDQELEGQRAPRLDHWLAHLQALGSGTGSQYPEMKFWRRLETGFVLAGAVLGVVAMSGLLFYDGGQQINITVILAFILLQLVLAIYTAIQGVAGWQPWAPVLERLLRKSPGADTPALKPLHAPLMARNAQAAGLAFGVTGLVTLLISVVLQDLAFGWSTTLDTSAGVWHDIVSMVAAPWAGWLPAAAPSLELVTETRFFRLAGSREMENAGRWGAWWPFVAMAWLTWVVLPRLILLLVARLDLRRQSRRALARHPGYPALLWRLETPSVDTGSDTPDSGQLPDLEASDTVAIPRTSLVVSWAGSPAYESQLPEGVGDPLPAGGNQSLAADRETLRELAARRNSSDGHLLVIARSWEPPTAELEDFLDEATDHLPGIRITLLPVATTSSSRPTAWQLAQWLRFAHRLGRGSAVAVPDEVEIEP
ncbi:Protein of unknown function [Marinobacter daqiaonensis]|uniref:DUF2868 domain-containing protein n=1 Tax=Marinobacter daqiaonensis TaxID=650891 RepID=A0A1I6IH12_9GAMM|nr:DUF2868 domain-containing protein [Marinobacter daqiaonensis]SFR65996.1 Protein of unknown function [Marinobacter daqiaonensis]